MMNCPNKEKNAQECACTYPSCSRKGFCCECLHYHLSKGEFPGCIFPPDAERTHDRSIEYFVSLHKKK